MRNQYRLLQETYQQEIIQSKTPSKSNFTDMEVSVLTSLYNFDVDERDESHATRTDKSGEIEDITKLDNGSIRYKRVDGRGEYEKVFPSFYQLTKDLVQPYKASLYNHKMQVLRAP